MSALRSIPLQARNVAIPQECSSELPVLQRAESAKSIYQRLGGRPAVLAAVELLYQKMLTDPRLQYFFAGVNMDVLKKHQASGPQSAARCKPGLGYHLFSPPAHCGAEQVAR